MRKWPKLKIAMLRLEYYFKHGCCQCCLLTFNEIVMVVLKCTGTAAFSIMKVKLKRFCFLTILYGC